MPSKEELRLLVDVALESEHPTVKEAVENLIVAVKLSEADTIEERKRASEKPSMQDILAKLKAKAAASQQANNIQPLYAPPPRPNSTLCNDSSAQEILAKLKALKAARDGS